MNAPNPTSIEPLAQRGLRFAALGLQAVLVTLLLLLLGLTAWPTPVYDQLQALMYGIHPSVPSWILCFGLGLALFLVALGVFLASWRLQVRSWWRIVLGYVALGVVLAYLAHDEAVIRHPLTMEEISPVFPGAEASYNVLMRYGKAHPLAQKFKAPDFKHGYPSFNPEASGPWRETITAHRAEFEAHWAELAPVRAWWAELNAFDRIGDLMPARMDAEIVSFQAFRTMSQHGVAIASLQALDGRGDDAIDTLLPSFLITSGLPRRSHSFRSEPEVEVKGHNLPGIIRAAVVGDKSSVEKIPHMAAGYLKHEDVPAAFLAGNDVVGIVLRPVRQRVGRSPGGDKERRPLLAPASLGQVFKIAFTVIGVLGYIHGGVGVTAFDYPIAGRP